MEGLVKLLEPIISNPGAYLLLIVGIWFKQWADQNKEHQRLHDRLKEKDAQLGEFVRTFDQLAHAIDLLKERLRNV